MNNYHTPVLLHQCIEALNIRPEGIYVDATFGGGGHSREILKRITNGKLFAFDCDEDALKNKIDPEHSGRFSLINRNFREIKFLLAQHGVTQINGLLADLGVSSHQFDTSERGFSTRFDAELDMRMDKRRNKLTANKILNSYSEGELKKIFSEYGEIENSGQLAKTIMTKGRRKIFSVNQLKEIINHCVKREKQNQYYAQVFQALRIEVNNELNALKDLLMQAKEILKSEGRIAIISYHSLEDRIVKKFFRAGNFEGQIEKDIKGNSLVPFRVVTANPIVPTQAEIENNNRARSAKLRIAEKL